MFLVALQALPLKPVHSTEMLCSVTHLGLEIRALKTATSEAQLAELQERISGKIVCLEQLANSIRLALSEVSKAIKDLEKRSRAKKKFEEAERKRLEKAETKKRKAEEKQLAKETAKKEGKKNGKGARQAEECQCILLSEQCPETMASVATCFCFCPTSDSLI